MARLLKCYGKCDGLYEKDNLIKHNNKNYCEPCLNIILKERKDRKELYDTIISLYDITFPTGQMLKQITKFMDEFGYTMRGITLTLLYASKKPNIVLHSKNGLSIIPYLYEEAKDDYTNKYIRTQNYRETKTEAITIKISKPNNENLLMKDKLIDLEDMIND